MTDGNEQKTEPAQGAGGGVNQGQPSLKWDDSGMSTSYANVVNISMTREEVGLFFGTNLTTGIGGGNEVSIKLSDRIIMTPLAAKRLSLLLQANLKAYEDRYGKLEIDVPGRAQ
jgi:Protein of unknown function (DUF3467)